MKMTNLFRRLSKGKKQRSKIKVKKVEFKQKINRINFHVGPSIPEKKFRLWPNKIKCLQRATRENYLYNGSFQEAIAPVLIMAQCFAVMPVMGVKSKSASDLYFSWISFRTIYSIVATFMLAIYTCITIYWSFSGEIEFDKIVPVIFYGSILFSCFCFGSLGRKWPKIIGQWEYVEKQFPQYQTQQKASELAYKIRMISIVVMSLSLVEHILNIISIVHHVNYCPNLMSDPIKDFFMAQLSQLFFIVNYSPARAFFGKILNIISTFLWTYMDLFVMLISVGLSTRFKQINEILLKYKGKQVPESFWIVNRLNYRRLCDLCETVDNAISKITMVSFSNNLYFICVQLLRSLNKMPSFAHALYFWFSLIFLITRTLAVSLYSADINDQSKKPIQIFRSVPRESWCIEVKRFCDEVTNDVVALSGMKFFHLTRKLVLSVAGTIVTYELVLIQFHEEEETVNDERQCK